MERRNSSRIYKDKVERYINLVMIKKGDLTKQDIARMTDMSPQNYSQKLKRGSLSATELFQIADKLNAEVKFVDRASGKIII